MAIPLKYNTASQEIPLGHFLDSTDGDTEEPSLTIANTDIKLWKSGATTLASKNSGGGTYISNGVYYAVLDATDTNTYGPMVIFVHVSGALAVRLECLVMEANAYDSMMAALGTGYIESNILQISGDSGAADNLEATYDGTGYTDDNAPSTQAQLSGLANVGSAVNRPAASYTLTTGTQSANTYTATEALDGTRHEHTDDTGVMELYYEFNIGSGTPSSVQVTGYVTGPNDDLDVYGYDWIAAGWVQIGNIQGSSSTSNAVNSFDMFVDMVGSGANSGVVRVRFYKASGLTSALLAVDQIFVAFNQGVSGYEGGAIWIDTALSNTNTVVGVDGTATNPVSTIGAANTLATATNLKIFQVAPNSTITLAATQSNQVFRGDNWNLELGGQDISGSHFYGAKSVTGIATGSSSANFHDCFTFACTLPPSHLTECGIGGTLTVGSAGDFILDDCHSHIAGATTPIIDTGAGIANVDLSMANYQNGIEIRNLNATGVDEFSISGIGQIIYAASCSGTVNQRGDWKVTNTGGVTITSDDNTTNVEAILEDTGTTIPGVLGTPAADMSADIAAVKVDTAATLVDTDELQGDWTNGGRLDLLLDALITEIDTAVGEPSQGAPGVSIKRGEKIDYIYKALRNKSTQTATQQSIYADDGTTVDHKATISDDGTTYTKGEFATGA